MNEHPDDVAIDGYLEDLLDARERAALDVHLAQCARCRDELARQRELLGVLAALPRAIEPDADLRPAIRADIRAARASAARRRWSRVPLAAAAVLMVAIGAGVISLLLAEPQPADRIAQGPGTRALPVSFEAARADYVRTADDLALLLERHRDELSPETVALVEESLATIDRAMAEAEAALRADPASIIVRDIILTTHAQKVEVLRWANELVEG